MNDTEQTFDLWCIVSLFGHQKIAGRCTEQNIAGTNMLRVDVPQVKDCPAFTRFYGSGAIYSIDPVTEDFARLMAAQLKQKPIETWDIKEAAKRMKLQLPPVEDARGDDDDFNL